MNVTRYKCSVLVVDDDPGIVSILMEQLEGDFDVLTASSAAEAREVLAQRSVDMVLTDLNLPDETGIVPARLGPPHDPTYGASAHHRHGPTRGRRRRH